MCTFTCRSRSWLGKTDSFTNHKTVVCFQKEDLSTLHKSFWGVTEILKRQEKSVSENSARLDIP